MTDMCLLLHGEEAKSYSDTPYRDYPSSSWILAFAIAVDKYNCLKSLRLHVQGILLGWLDKNPEQTPHGIDEGNIMAAAFLLESRRAFFLITERLTQRCNARFTGSVNAPFSTRFPQDLLRLLPGYALCKSTH